MERKGEAAEEYIARSEINKNHEQSHMETERKESEEKLEDLTIEKTSNMYQS